MSWQCHRPEAALPETADSTRGLECHWIHCVHSCRLASRLHIPSSSRRYHGVPFCLFQLISSLFLHFPILGPPYRTQDRLLLCTGGWIADLRRLEMYFWSLAVKPSDWHFGQMMAYFTSKIVYHPASLPPCQVKKRSRKEVIAPPESNLPTHDLRITQRRLQIRFWNCRPSLEWRVCHVLQSGHTQPGTDEHTARVWPRVAVSFCARRRYLCQGQTSLILDAQWPLLPSSFQQGKKVSALRRNHTESIAVRYS